LENITYDNEVYAIIGYILGVISLYLTAYIKEKAKLNASQKEIEKIRKEHSLEIEKIKKEHSLEIEKRKIKYDSKKTQYFKFMEEFDKFNGCFFDVLREDFSQMMLSYFEACTKNNLRKQSQLTVDFNKKAFDAITKIQIQESKLFSQFNGLKLSTTNDIILILNDFALEIKKTSKKLENMINYISSESFLSTGIIPKEILINEESTENKILELKEKLMSALKKDLDEL